MFVGLGPLRLALPNSLLDTVESGVAWVDLAFLSDFLVDDTTVFFQ